MKKLVLVLSVFLLGFSNPFRPIHVFMIGDSTMANKPETAIPEYGWGQVLYYFFNDSVVIDNYARNGRSSKSFIDEGRWDSVVSQLHNGDYVIIQFGHNDSKPDTTRNTDPFTTYKTNLKKFIKETREKGAFPILCTSIVRRQFSEDGSLIDTHGDYLTAVKEVAEETQVFFIDLEAKTRNLLLRAGLERSRQYYLHVDSGVYPLRPAGLKDNTHLSQLGAFTIANLATEGMKELAIPLTRYLVNK